MFAVIVSTFARRFVGDQRRCRGRAANKGNCGEGESSGPHHCDSSITAAFPRIVFGKPDRSEADRTWDRAGAPQESAGAPIKRVPLKGVLMRQSRGYSRPRVPIRSLSSLINTRRETA